MLDQLVSLRLEVASAPAGARRSGAVAAGHHQSGDERHGGDGGRHRPSPRAGDRAHRHEGEQVLIEVCDSGVGIELQVVDNLFNAFFTTKPNGMGMGLSISRSIIEARTDGYGPPATPAPARHFTSRCHRTGRLRRDGVRRGRERRADRVRHRRRRVGTQRTLESLPLGRLARAGLRLGVGVPAEQLADARAAWSSTSGCRDRADSIFKPNWPRRTSISRSSS